ncbi:MAG: pitrilysin family protein [Melioribacteraceae bacterium]|nr:pitrilysin family protein [Melioribacteraceae bacterium]
MKTKLILFLLFSVTYLFAQARKIEFTEYTMDNGLHVILHQDNNTPIVAVSIMYHVGSKNEDPERTGFAHFFEHLMFEGSKYIGRGEFDVIMESAGGINNASTSHDRTYYYEILPSNQLELGLWIESERLLHAKIDTIGVETQRKVVKEERRQNYDNQPYGSVIEETFKRAYREHPYNWLPIGSVQYIDEATIDEFRDFYNTFYTPENATLVIAGDIDRDNTKSLVNKYFSDIPRGVHQITRPNVIEPPLNGEVRDTVYDNIQLPLVLHAYRIPANGTKDAYPLELLTTLLSSGQSSRLRKSLVDNQQKALNIGAFPYSLEDSGLFITYGISNIGVTADELEKAMQDELDKVINELITETEFQKLKNQIENSFVSSNSTVAGIASSLATYHVLLDDANLINTEIERYNAVTIEDLNRVAKEYLSQDNRVVLYYLPKSEEK